MFNDIIKNLANSSNQSTKVESVNIVTNANMYDALISIREAAIIQANSSLSGSLNPNRVSILLNQFNGNIQGYMKSILDELNAMSGESNYLNTLQKIIDYSNRTGKSYLNMTVNTYCNINNIRDILIKVFQGLTNMEVALKVGNISELISPYNNYQVHTLMPRVDFGQGNNISGIEIGEFSGNIKFATDLVTRMNSLYDNFVCILSTIKETDGIINYANIICEMYIRQFILLANYIDTSLYCMYSVITQMATQIK